MGVRDKKGQKNPCQVGRVKKGRKIPCQINRCKNIRFPAFVRVWEKVTLAGCHAAVSSDATLFLMNVRTSAPNFLTDFPCSVY